MNEIGLICLQWGWGPSVASAHEDDAEPVPSSEPATNAVTVAQDACTPFKVGNSTRFKPGHKLRTCHEPELTRNP